MYRVTAALIPIALAACAPAADSPLPEKVAAAPIAEEQPSDQPPAPAVTEAELFGGWRIVSVNGAAPLGLNEEAGRTRTPRIVFSRFGYGGSTGCNSFGGLGVLEGDRYYGSPAGQTLIGCGALTAQEDAIIRLFTSSPTVAKGEGGRLVLTSGARSLVLEREPLGSGTPRTAAAPEDVVLAGSRWTIDEVDGERLAYGSGRTLVLEADGWSLGGSCGAPSGVWRQAGDRIVAEAGRPAGEACPAADVALAERVAALMGSRPRFVTGPNGEILIGGGDHWLWATRRRERLADQAEMLAGSWQVVAIDGAPPLPGSGPRLAFSRTGYSGGTGCNALQGLFLAHGRRLYTGWGLQTERGCGGALEAQERRIATLLARAPRIALAGLDQIALADAEGSLRLRREEGGAAWGPEATAWTGQPLEGELVMIDGAPSRVHHTEPEAWLRLTAEGWEIRSGCARLGGIWRRRDGALEFLTDNEARPEGACGGVVVERLYDLSRLGNGEVRAIVGQSGELLLAGEDHWLAARVGRASGKRR